MKRFTAVFVCAVLLFVSLVYVSPSTAVHAATKQELEDEIDRLNGEISKNKQQLNELANKKESQQEYLNTLESQISAVEKKVDNLETQIKTIDNEIDTYNKQLTKLNNEITVIEDEINVANQQIKETKNNISESEDLLSTKLRSYYINGKDSTLKILMGSDSLAGFLTSLEMMKRMSEDDKKVINDFKDKVIKLNKAKSELEEKQTTLVDKQASVEETKAKSVEKKRELTTKQAEYDKSVTQLEKDYASVEKYIADLDKSSAIYQNYVKSLEAEKAAADKEIDELIKSYQATSQAQQSTTLPASNGDPSKTSQSTGGSYASSGTWGWPLGNTSCYISSGYGNRSASISGWSFHGGIDITGGGIYGKPVYASRAGTVIAAVWGSTGYGRYVVIDHGDGYTTVYGHCSNLTVSQGQSVSKGQQIANVGSTGNSTGPHLHFEVRHNGSKQNPLNYVKKP
ncbi:MAG: peptidoglycan DD-metalloendopeptidase family protein [Faecalibacterium sp.]|nr:peptidoglycan DD-metalloendopeptidase family protein [Ruminococcus sp.]MCM1391955.1 peptidoglycan DD-metalloendopeptidase family protein [Ruminococcus sp.]MCM1484983.1 peptidoglycan DD-metalloendopeptidase family protein [Faecalibacterium sp.]